MEINPNECELTPEVTPERNSKKPLLIGLIIALLIISGVVYAYVSLDVFKSDKQIYAEVEVKNFMQVKKNYTKAYDTYFENFLQPYLENSVHQTAEWTVSLEGIDTIDPSVNIALGLLRKCKLIVTSEVDNKKQYAYSKFDLAIENNNLIGLECVSDQTKLALKAPAFYDKYLFVDLQDRELLQEKLGIEGIPRKVLKNQDVYDALKFTSQETKVFYAYARFFLDSINEEQVTLSEGTFSEGDFKVEDCRMITITFDSNHLKELNNKFRQKMANDEDLVDLIYNKWESLYQLFEDAGYPMEEIIFEKLTKEQIREGLKSFVEEKPSAGVGSTADTGDGFKMVLYIDKNDRILERNILPLDDKNTGVLRCASWTDQGKKENWLFQMKSPDENDPGELKISHQSISPQENEKKGTFLFSFVADGEEMEWKNDYTYKLDKSKLMGELTFSVNLDQTEMVYGEIKTDMDKNAKEKSKKGVTKAKLALNIPSESINNVGINLEVKHSEVFGQKISPVKLNDDNSVNVVQATEAELETIFEEITIKGQKFIAQNQALFLQFMGL
jgi:hypothetical protein